MAKKPALITPEFRVSFCEVFKAVAFKEGDEPVFGLTMLFDKNADLSQIRQAIKDAAVEKWGQKVPSGLKLPIKDGDEKDFEGYAGKFYIRAKTYQKPGLVDANLQEIIDPREFYSGCYAVASIKAVAFDKNGGRGVRIQLNNIKKTRDGEPFASRSSPQDDFAGTAGGGASGGDDLSDMF